MTTYDQALDGNVLAGILRGVFSFEPTASMAMCAGCGTRVPVGAWMVFVSAPGMVARCGTCDRVQLRVVHNDKGSMWVDLSGIASIEIAP
jgi:hypothetical protein